VTTTDYLLAVTVYVMYLSPHPKKETVERVMKKLHKNNIDASQLVEFRSDIRQQAGPSTERGRDE
jgi:hypothetical protein